MTAVDAKGYVWIKDASRDELEKLRAALSFVVPGREHMPLFKRGDWDGVKRFFDWRLKRFRRGLAGLVERKTGLSLGLARRKAFQLPKLLSPGGKVFEVRPFQPASLKALLGHGLSGPGGIAKLATNAGKTAVIAGVAKAMFDAGVPIVIFERMEDLLVQVKKEIEDWSGLRLGEWSARMKEVAPAMVVMAQSASQSLGRVMRYEGTPADEALVGHLRSIGAVAVDECISGDSIVETELGLFKIKDLRFSKSKYILTYDVHRGRHFGRFYSWKNKGVQKVYALNFSDGKRLVCTEDHLVACRGNTWCEALSMKIGQEVVGIVPAAAGSWFGLQLLRMFVFCLGMISTFVIGISHCIRAKFRRCSELCLAMLISGFHIFVQRIRESRRRTVRSRLLGRGIRLRFFRVLTSMNESGRILALEKKRICSSLLRVLRACPACGKSIISLLNGGVRKLRNFGLTILDDEAWHGGIVMMEVALPGGLRSCIPKAILCQRICWLGVGFLKNSVKYLCCVLGGEMVRFTIILRSIKSQLCAFFRTLKSTCRNVCDISYPRITSVEFLGADTVYDISVENTHCFFANGILVHNCHHGSADSYERLLDLNPDSMRFGFSGTVPPEDDIDGVALRALFGDVVAEVTNAELIAAGISARPTIRVVEYEVEGLEEKAKEHGKSVRAECFKIVGQDESGKKIRRFSPSMYTSRVREYAMNYAMRHDVRFWDTVKGLLDRHPGKSAAVLVDWVEFSKDLSRHIGAEVLHGEVARADRERIIAGFSSGKIERVVATSVLDEGMSIDRIRVLVLANAGSSIRQFLQRIGRGLRKKLDDNTLTVYCFVMYGHKYLLGPSKERLKIWRNEGFEVIFEGEDAACISTPS